MLSLFVISIVVSSIIGFKAAIFYRDISDRELGYEEIIAVTIILGAGINTCIDIMNILSYSTPTFSIHIKQFAVISRLAESLISYCVIQYVTQMHKMRLDSKEK